MYNESSAEHHEEASEGGLRGRFHRLIDQITGRKVEEYEEEYEEEPARTATATRAAGAGEGAPRGNTYRIASMRETTITIMPVGTFGDIQKAADRLKDGEPQIINLEKTPPEIAERLIDFLNGVTYALNGQVEKIAENAYLFTPSHVTINADGPDASPKSPFERM